MIRVMLYDAGTTAGPIAVSPLKGLEQAMKSLA